MTYIYNEVFSMEKDQIESLKKDLLRKYKTAQETFGDADEEDQANSQTLFLYLSFKL